MADKKGVEDEQDDDRDDEESSEADESSDSNAKVERSASTKGVAKALGVDDDEEEEGEEEEAAAKPAAPPNRAARRRDEVLKKRRAARGEDEKPAKAKSDDEDAEGEGEEEDEAPVVAARDPLPKDKNARAKELLRRRKEAAEGKSADIGLSAGEVVQDQLARAGSATGRWFQRHFRKIIVASVVGLAAVIGTIQYLNYREQQAGKATDALMKGVAAESSPNVYNDDRKDMRSEQFKAYDPNPIFATFGARTDAALASYSELAAKDATSGVGVLAKLSEAGALLDKAQYQQAENAFAEVLKTDLAKADLDVKARAMEGKGMALEGKKDFDGAAAIYKELEAVDKSFEDLAKYHQARMHLQKGEKDQAKEILLALEKKLEIPTVDGVKQVYLKSAVADYLRKIDPALGRRPNFGGTRGAVTPEQMEMYRKQIEQMKQQQQQEHGEHGDEEGPPGAPGPGAEHGDDGTR